MNLITEQMILITEPCWVPTDYGWKRGRKLKPEDVEMEKLGENGSLRTTCGNYIISRPEFWCGRMRFMPKGKWSVLSVRPYLRHYREWLPEWVVGSFETPEEAEDALWEVYDQLDIDWKQDGGDKQLADVEELAEEKLRAREDAPRSSKPLYPEGPVDLNNAEEGHLCTLPRVGLSKAQAIIGARPLGSLDDLLKLKGIGKNMIETIRTLVVLGEVADG